MEEKNLEVERPTTHIIVEINEVWIVVGGFVMYFPSEGSAELGTKSRFACADVPGDGYIFDALVRCVILFHYRLRENRFPAKKRIKQHTER